MRDSYSQLNSDWSSLQQQWQSARRDWQDGVAARFEKQYWHEYENVLPLLLGELANLEETIDRAFRSL